MRSSSEDINGKITLKWSSVRNIIAVLVLLGSAVTIVTTYTELRSTTYNNAARLFLMEKKLDDHITDAKIHTEKTVLKETREDLLQRIDALQRQVDNANNKLDRILLRGK